MSEDIITRLRKRAEIRRQIQTRKSVQEGAPDRIADLLEEAARAIEEKDDALSTQVELIACSNCDIMESEIKRLRGALEKYKHISLENGVSHFSYAAEALASNPPPGEKV